MIRDFATLLNKLESKYPVFATDIRAFLFTMMTEMFLNLIQGLINIR